MRKGNQAVAFAPWLAVLIIILVVVLPLGGAPPYGDDMRLHIFRIPVVLALWENGVPFARWLPTLNLGHGSPLFNFYPPLSAYLLTAFYLLVNQQTAVAWNGLLALALAGGCVGMFLLARWLFGAAGGVLAAALYTWAPHLVAQSYARGSSSNALAMALFPWVVGGMLAVTIRPSPLRICLAGLSIALLMLAHTAASLLFLGPLILLAGTAVWFTPSPRGAALRAILLTLALGLALSAFSWLPALAEIGDTRYAQEAGKVAYQDYFADVLRWPEQMVAGVHNPGLPKTPGLAQIALGTGGTARAIIGWWRGRRGATAVPVAVAAVSGLMGLIVLIVAMPSASWLWMRLPPLQSLQFPWRLLDIPTFCLALASGFVLYAPFLQSRSRWVAGRWAVVIAGLVLAFANVLPYLYPPRIHSLPAQLTLADATAVQQQFGIFGLTAWGEYSAASVRNWPLALPFADADQMVPLYAKSLDTPEGVTAVAGDPWRAIWQTDLSQAETMTLSVHDFPGWQARLDGEKLVMGVDGDGRIQLNIPSGSHRVELAFRRTPVRWLADGLTVAGLVVAGGLLVWGRHAMRRKETMAALKMAGGRWVVPLTFILLLLLGSKIVWFDRAVSPLVVHPMNGRVPGKMTPDFGNFNNELRLIAYETRSPDTLVLYWQAVAAPAHRYAVTVTLADAQGVPLHTVVNDAPGYMSTSHWEAGQLVRDVYHLPVDEYPAPAGFTVWVGLQRAADGETVSLHDAPGVTAVPVGRLKTLPPSSDAPETLGTIFGEAIRLRQVVVPEHLTAGEMLNMTLVWESLAVVPEDFTVFVHLLNPDGTLAEGNDGQPLDGRYPTSYWSSGEIIADERRWQPNVPPGTYQLEVGLYRLESGERLPVSGPHSEWGDRVVVGSVEIGGSK
jgi:hypothetical protein